MHITGGNEFNSHLSGKNIKIIQTRRDTGVARRRTYIGFSSCPYYDEFAVSRLIARCRWIAIYYTSKKYSTSISRLFWGLNVSFRLPRTDFLVHRSLWIVDPLEHLFHSTFIDDPLLCDLWIKYIARHKNIPPLLKWLIPSVKSERAVFTLRLYARDCYSVGQNGRFNFQSDSSILHSMETNYSSSE